MTSNPAFTFGVDLNINAAVSLSQIRSPTTYLGLAFGANFGQLNPSRYVLETAGLQLFVLDRGDRSHSIIDDTERPLYRSYASKYQPARLYDEPWPACNNSTETPPVSVNIDS